MNTYPRTDEGFRAAERSIKVMLDISPTPVLYLYVSKRDANVYQVSKIMPMPDEIEERTAALTYTKETFDAR